MINGGMDQQVQNAMMSAKGDPQVLAQRYQQGRSLIDLLAMQKLKSEKDAAARNLQMQMEDQPQTIVEQREEELMGANRSELMAKMGPTLARTGQESMPNPQGQPQGPPQQGIAGAAPAGSFAQGGIVGYDEERRQQLGDESAAKFDALLDGINGGDSSEVRAKIRFALKSMSPQALIAEVAGSNPAMIQMIQSEAGRQPARPALEELAPEVANRLTESLANIQQPKLEEIATSGRQPVLSDFEKAKQAHGPDFLERLTSKMLSAGPAGEYLPKGGIGSILPNISPVQKAAAAEQPPVDYSMPMDGPTQADPNALAKIKAQLTAPQPEPQPQADPAGIAAVLPQTKKVDPLTAAMEKAAIDGVNRDPTAEANANADRYSRANTGVKAKEGEADDQRARYDALYKKLNDPDKLKRERFRAFAANMGNTGNFGSNMAGGLRGSAAARAGQEKRQMEGLENLKAMLDTDTEGARKSADGLYGAGDTAMARAETGKNQAMASGSAMVNRKVDAQVRTETNAVLAETNRLNRQNASEYKLSSNLTRVSSQLSDTRELIETAISMDMMQLRGKLKDAQEDGDKEEIDKIRQEIIDLRADAAAPYAEDIARLTAEAKRLEKELNGGESSNAEAKAQYSRPKQVN